MSKKAGFKVFTCIMTGIILAAIIKLFVLGIVRVEGISMENSLKDQDTIYINKLAYGIVNPFSDKLIVQWNKPVSDDIILYFYNNNLIVKRCVAVEGDNLEYFNDSGYYLTINGNKKIPLTKEQFNKMSLCSQVPESYVLAVGDNYMESYDSRNYGFIPVNNILGKVICRPTDSLQKAD